MLDRTRKLKRSTRAGLASELEELETQGYDPYKWVAGALLDRLTAKRRDDVKKTKAKAWECYLRLVDLLQVCPPPTAG